MRRPLAASVLALLISSAAPAAAFDVTACYQTIPEGETGVLRNDLACDGSGGPNVNVGRHSKLDLNGHTISGGYIGVATSPGHIGECEIYGPGEIFGIGAGGGLGDPFGAGISAAGKVSVRNVALHDNVRGIVSVYDFAMKLEDVTITNNSAEGIASYFGNLAERIGPGKGQIKARNCVVSGNGDDGIEAWGKLDLRDSTVSGNAGTGIVSKGRVFTLKDVTITDNANAGLLSTSQKPGNVKGGTLTGNGPGGDVAAPVAPKLVASTCEHSVDTDGGTLGICTGD